LLCVLLCGTPSCDDHQLVDVSRCEEHPRAIRRWWFRCMICMGWTLISLLGFSLGLRPMYLFVLGSTYFLCKHFIQFSFGHRGVLWIVRSWVLNSRTALLCYLFVTLPLISYIKLNGVLHNLVFYFKFFFQFSTLFSLFFKTIQFCLFQFKTKLVNKLNYNLYIHVIIICFNIYIKSLHLNT